MKKVLATIVCGSLLLLGSCGEKTTPSEEGPTNTTTNITSVPTNVPTSTPTTKPTSVPSTTSKPTSTTTKPNTDKVPTIYLAGDSTVKTYSESTFIGGWGQYLDLFLEDDVKVANAAQGGRSSRSFINEGRLYNIENESFKYTFSENGGKSIEDCIQAGDYLFVQFGHNDDDTKKYSSYSSMYDRMTPLGTPDSNGIYPTIPATKVPTSSLPAEYVSNSTSADQTKALAEIAKYGTEYYSYDCGGTYKWYLKQYIDFARSKGATPVLVTPVARVKFSNGQIIGGDGLHGANFAYVQAVRQLAQEENCLLIDLFADTKTILETATQDYANYLMALKPNDIVGEWPSGYDKTYGNSALGYTGIEATHYNKYGAYLQAAMVAAHIKNSNVITSTGESFNFGNKVLTTPQKYIDPSNLISKSVVAQLEALNTTINVTNPNRAYADPNVVVNMINALTQKGDVTQENYLEIKALCEEIRVEYYNLNIDDRSTVNNLTTLETYEAQVKVFEEANRPKPTRVEILKGDDASAYSTITEATTINGFTVVGTEAKSVTVHNASASFVYNGDEYSTSKAFSMGGSASFGSARYISFTVTGECKVTVVAKSSGSSDRTLALVNSSNTAIGTFDAKASLSITTQTITEAGTYSIGSTGSGMYVYYIIIEYFN